MSDSMINGENRVGKPATPLQALENFYSAFNQRSSTLMQDCWLQSEEASMSNPLGGVKRGWQDIAAVYEKIFSGPARVYVEFYDFSIHETETMFCAVGRERGHLFIDGRRIELKIRTSRIYRKDDGLWKHLHHHGSMDDPEMLHRYQQSLLYRAA